MTFRLSTLRAIQFSLGLTYSTQPEVRKYAELFSKQKLSDFVNSLAEESKHYRSNLELEKAPEVLHFVLTDISNKLSRKDETNCDSESSHTFHSYQVIRERLYTSALEAQSLIKESQILPNSISTAYLRLSATEKSNKVPGESLLTGSLTSESLAESVEAREDKDHSGFALQNTDSSVKILSDLLNINSIGDQEIKTSLEDMPGSNTAGTGGPGNNTLNNMATVAAMAAAAGNIVGGSSGTGNSGSSSQSRSHLDNALPELVRECGYQFTVSVEACRNNLRNWIGTNGEIHAATVARIIGVMVRTHTGLDDSASLQNLNATGTSLWEKDKDPASPKTWNLEVFIKVVHELPTGSTLHWKEIIYELDHSEFLVKDRQGLSLLIKALKLGFQVQGFQGPFPVDMFYRQWKYSDGQVSLLQQILRYPDIFNFVEHHHHPVAVEVLKGKFRNQLNLQLKIR